jgi:hypothetical protein
MMTRSITAWMAIVALALAASPVADARQRGGAPNSASVAGAPTVDGTGSISTSSGVSTLALTVATTQAEDLLIAFTNTSGSVATGASGCGLTWTQRAIVTSPAGTYEFTAPSASIQSSCTVTISFSFAAIQNGAAFGIHGAGVVSPTPDVNASLPSYNASGTTTYSTTNADDLAISYYSSSGSATPSCPTGFTTIVTSADNTSACAEALSATQSGTSVVGATFPQLIVVDAFKS